MITATRWTSSAALCLLCCSNPPEPTSAAAAPSSDARPAPVDTAAPVEVAADAIASAEAAAAESAPMLLFLLIGQSNMAGIPKPDARDGIEDPRVRVLAYEDCPQLGRTYNQWYRARPPLHDCTGGLGPGDHFGKTLARAYPERTIGLVPLAVSGVDIDFFLKGVVSKRRGEFTLPPDNHWPGAYEWCLDRARLAQQSGSIAGIIFHQGKPIRAMTSGCGKVKQLVTDLRTDLKLGQAPFVAGELLYGGCCAEWHNPLVQRLPQAISEQPCRVRAGARGDGRGALRLGGAARARRPLWRRHARAIKGLEPLKASAAAN